MSIREFYIEKEDKKLYTVLSKPDTRGKVPLVIYAHGLGSSHYPGLEYAKSLLEYNIATLTFDFCGGGYNSKSSGNTTGMSILTELDDLEVIVDYVSNFDWVSELILLGASQGGVVSALLASKLKNRINKLILLYPAFVIKDDIHETFKTKENIPDTFNYKGWIKLGSIYPLDVWDMDFYNLIKEYHNPVFIMHGDRDGIVPLNYSTRANNLYSNSNIEVISGAGHGFYGEDFLKVINLIIDFIT